MIGWIGDKIWLLVTFISGLLLLGILARRNGQLKERLNRSEGVIEIQKRMRDAVANTPTDRRSVVKRLRNGSF